MRRYVFALAVALAAAGTAAAADFSTLEERMTASEFKAAGLDKLSPQELDRLNAWLKSHGLASAPAGAAASSAEPGFKPKSFLSTGEGGPITAHIVGDFKGWSGSSHFVLDNGQEWKQTEASEFVLTKPMHNPQVTISQGLLGGWSLKVEGYNRTTGVTRVK